MLDLLLEFLVKVLEVLALVPVLALVQHNLLFQNQNHHLINIQDEKEEKKITLKFKRTDLEYITTNVKKIEKAEKLFEKQLVVTLVSRFDEFLGKILKLILEKNPEWVISDDKTISYKDLIALDSEGKFPG